jgi:hypothetical protein
MGCNCKKPQVLNNLWSEDHLRLAQDVFERIITKKSIDEFDDLDKLEIFSVYQQIWPNAKIQPEISNAVFMITEAKEMLKTKNRR